MRVLLPKSIRGEPPTLGQVVHTLTGETMGTYWCVQWVACASLAGAPLRRIIEQVLADVITQMSSWESDSQLSQFNRLPAGNGLVLAAGFAQVIEAALQVAQQSDGAFDPCAGGAVNHWGFGPGDAYKRPGFSPSAGSVDPPSKNWQALQWHAPSARLTQPGGVVLDLSAIAKGYAVDHIANTLLACGLEHHLVDIGGELRGSGFKPGAQPWWVDLEPPRADSGLPLTRVALHGMAVATSGDYRRSFADAQGQRCSHTIDPRNGTPVRHGLASASVLHESAMLADAWSTALMVLGLQAGLQRASEQGLAALLVQRQPDGKFTEILTPAMQEWCA